MLYSYTILGNFIYIDSQNSSNALSTPIICFHSTLHLNRNPSKSDTWSNDRSQYHGNNSKISVYNSNRKMLWRLCHKNDISAHKSGCGRKYRELDGSWTVSWKVHTEHAIHPEHTQHTNKTDNVFRLQQVIQYTRVWIGLFVAFGVIPSAIQTHHNPAKLLTMLPKLIYQMIIRKITCFHFRRWRWIATSRVELKKGKCAIYCRLWEFLWHLAYLV